MAEAVSRRPRLGLSSPEEDRIARWRCCCGRWVVGARGMLGRGRRTRRGREDLLAATEGFKVRLVE